MSFGAISLSSRIFLGAPQQLILLLQQQQQHPMQGLLLLYPAGRAVGGIMQ